MQQAAGALPEAAPLAVVAKIKNAFRVAAVDRIAEKRGVRIGMGLADARGSAPDLAIAEGDEAADLALLEAIADWCDRYTPLVALDPPFGLFLDISGCAHLFAGSSAGGRSGDVKGDSGEAALLSDCLRRLVRQGFEAQGAIASTAGAAWALAHSGGGGCVPPGAEAEAIAGLPMAALRIGAEQDALLDRLGLKRIGQLIGQPRAPLAARFGIGLGRRLDQALGVEDEVLSPRRPAPQLSAERRFAEPVVEEAALLEAVASLARTLRPSLERQGIGARSMEASFFRIDGKVLRAAISTASPIRAPDRIAILFSERLSVLHSDWDAGFGFETVRLAVLHAEKLADSQIDLSGEGASAPDFACLVDRLGARLGPSRITRFAPVDTHIPERAWRAEPLAACVGTAAWNVPQAAVETPPDRPLRLFSRPEPISDVLAEVPDGPPARFCWRNVVYHIKRAEGPERIAPEWWRAEDRDRHTRDYFRIEDADGRRYWIFREGFYGHQAGEPAWYMHGLFA